MNAYWFKPKTYGYGAVPVTWQGWAVIGVAVIAIAAAALLTLGHDAKEPRAWITFFTIEALILAGLFVVTRRKTDGEWRWRWGQR
jgi:hypothetical protein